MASRKDRRFIAKVALSRRYVVFQSSNFLANVGETSKQYCGGLQVHRPKSGANQLLHGLNQSSRIIKASRSSSGKDRCGKILIGKGLKDRKVKLSVAIASRFYDILDRLDYNHPEKDVKWLIRVASDAIYKLPSLPTYSFPDATEQLSDNKRPSVELKLIDLDEIDNKRSKELKLQKRTHRVIRVRESE
nr:transcription factor PCF6-like [Ziziphus jujuba var. spinosa]